MFLKSIQTKNFKLFKELNLSFDKINVITGENKDSQDNSSNGSGKSTITEIIQFNLYGVVSNINLKDLISFGQKEARVELIITQGSDTYRIIRSIPSDLYISVNDKEIQLNTNTLKQQWLDQRFGTYDFFKKFRMIDSKGINLLELGIISLRKELMSFVDGLFLKIRVSLLNKKNEREILNIDKRLYKFSLSEKRLNILKKGLERLAEESTLANLDCMEQFKVVNNLKAEIQAREKQIYFKQQDKKKLNNGVCPILNSKCSQISEQLDKVNREKTREIANIEAEIKDFEVTLRNELELGDSYKKMYDSIQEHVQKVNEYSRKLKEAFKFKEYKYTAKDVLLYTEAIKTLDSFAGYYIETWLKQLELIINELLKEINLSVEFSAEKDFIKIKDGENELKFEQLSSGQKTFLSAIFKMAILIHRGETSGIILADEGLGNLDAINLKKFIEVCKSTNFQFIIIYQNLPNLEDVKKIEVIREKGVSNVC